MPYERYVPGTRVRATANIPYAHYALIEQGEYGTVTDVIPEAEGIEITWEKVHKGLALWDNSTLLVSGELCIEPAPPSPASPGTQTATINVSITVGIWRKT